MSMPAPGGRPSPAADEPADAVDGRRVPPAAVVAVVLVAVGVVAQVWRPVAPDVGAVATDLDRFAPEVEAAIAAFRAPLPWVGLAVMLGEVAVAAAFVLTPWGRAVVARLAGGATTHGGRLLARAGLVAGALWGVIQVAVLPARFWVEVVHAGAHGLRVGGAGSWWAPTLTALAMEVVLAAGLAVLVVALVRARPATWHWHLVWAGTAAGVVVVLLWPWVVAPLLRPQAPLPDTPAAREVHEVLAAAGLADARVVVGEESSRTVFVNAQVVGVGPTRTVVVWDTLLELPPAQVGAVVAHELAHQRAGDLERGALAAGIGLLPVALLLRRGLRSARVRALVGARWTLDPRLVAAGVLLVVAVRLAADPVALWQSRRVEAAADQEALELTGDPAAVIALQRRLAVRNLGRIDRPRWQQLLFATHPDRADRIARAVAFARAEDIDLPPLAAFPGAPQRVDGGGEPAATPARSSASPSTITSQS